MATTPYVPYSVPFYYIPAIIHVELPKTKESAASLLATFFYKHRTEIPQDQVLTVYAFLLEKCDLVTHIDLAQLTLTELHMKELAQFSRAKLCNIDPAATPYHFQLFHDFFLHIRCFFTKTAHNMSAATVEQACQKLFPELFQLLEELKQRLAPAPAAAPAVVLPEEKMAMAAASAPAVEEVAKAVAALSLTPPAAAEKVPQKEPQDEANLARAAQNAARNLAKKERLQRLKAAIQQPVAIAPKPQQAAGAGKEAPKSSTIVVVKLPKPAPVTPLVIAPALLPVKTAFVARPADDILPIVISYLFPKTNHEVELVVGESPIPESHQAMYALLRESILPFPHTHAPLFLRLFNRSLGLLHTPQGVIDRKAVKAESVANNLIKGAAKEFARELDRTFTPHAVRRLDLEKLQVAPSKKHEWADRLFTHYSNVQEIALPEGTLLDPELAKLLARQKGLQSIAGAHLRAKEALIPLATLPLTELFLEECDLTDEGFAALAKTLKLKRLSFTAKMLDERSAVALTAMRSLQNLTIITTQYPVSEMSRKTFAKRADLKVDVTDPEQPHFDAAPAVFDERAMYRFFVGPNMLDLRSVTPKDASQFHLELPGRLQRSQREVSQLRLPVCELNSKLVDAFAAHKITMVNAALCKVRDFAALAARNSLTSLTMAHSLENQCLVWESSARASALSQFLIERLAPVFRQPGLVQPVSGIELQQIAKMTRLTQLNLGYSPLSDEDIVPLAALSNLEELYIANTTITAKGIRALQPLTKLRALHLPTNKSLKDKGLQAIVECFPHLEELALDANHLTDAAIDLILKLPRLHTLILGLQRDITPAGLKKLAKLQLVQKLSVASHKAFPESWIRELMMMMPCLKVLKLFVQDDAQQVPEDVQKLAAHRGRKIYIQGKPAAAAK